LAQSVYDLCEGAEGNGFVGAKKNGVLRLFELRLNFRAELVDIHGNVSEIDELVLVDGDDEAGFVDLFYGLRLGDVDFDAGLENRGGDHENNEQDENNVDERDHVDLGERALRLFGELRHSVHWPPWAGGRNSLRKSLFDLSSDFQGKSVEALRQIADTLQKVIVEDNRRYGDEEACGGGDKRFGDAGCDGSEAGGAGVSEAGEGVNDAPNGAEEADEWCHRPGGGQPGHAFFDAPDFFGGSKLHADGNGLEALQFSSGLRISSADLA
jgi:hypothetical protein